MDSYVFAGEITEDIINDEENDDPRAWWDRLSEDKESIMNDEEANKNASSHMWGRIRSLEKADIYRIDQSVRFERFYNINTEKTNTIAYAIQQSSYNVIRSNCNTAQSKLGKEMPKIAFLTDRAQFGLRNAAKMLDQYIEAEFERSELYENVRTAILDACISRLGIVKVLFDKEKKRFKTERIRPLQFIVDDNNSMYTKKRETFEKKKVSVNYLLSAFPDMPKWKQELLKKEGATSKIACFEGYYQDKIKVYFTKNCILKIMPWEGQPPYFYWRWTQSTCSFWGIGIADELAAIQRKINDILLKISRSMDLFAVPRIIMNTHDNITGVRVSNELGSVVKVSTSGDGASKMNFLTPPVLHDQFFAHLEDLYMKSYQITGISQLSSSGQKPKGLSSGRALLAYHDIQTDRFAQASQNLVDMYVDIARYMAMKASKMFSGKKGDLLPYKVEWDKLDVKNNIYQIKQYPVNLLSKSPAGRLEDVQMLINMGVIPPEKGIQLLDFPDVGKAIDMLTATDQAVEHTLEKVVDGEMIDPDPSLPMGRQIETAQKFYGRIIVEGADDDVLDRIENFIVKGKEMIKKEIEEQQKAQGAATDAVEQGQDVVAPPGPLSPQAAGNLPVPAEGMGAAMPMNQGGMR